MDGHHGLIGTDIVHFLSSLADVAEAEDLGMSVCNERKSPAHLIFHLESNACTQASVNEPYLCPLKRWPNPY